MRHLNKGKKFNRKKGQRAAFMKSLANNVILKGKIETTEVRAKEIKPYVERLITIAKKQDLAAFRILLACLTKGAAEKAYYDLAPKYKERKGGYLRIIKGTKMRMKDGSAMAIIEFV